MSTQEVGKLIDAVNNLTQTVANKNKEIDSRVENAEKEFNDFMVQSRSESSIFRQSKNQYCNLTDTNLDSFSKNNQYPIEVSLYREITSGVLWEDRDVEEKDIMTAMGMANKVNFQPSIRVMKMIWNGFQTGVHNSYSIYPNPAGNASGWITMGSYAKLISGSINNWWLQGVDDTWGLCGTHVGGSVGKYVHAHPYVESASGEVLFIWPAMVSGYVPLDRSVPKWGYWPSIYGNSGFDTQPGS